MQDRLWCIFNIEVLLLLLNISIILPPQIIKLKAAVWNKKKMSLRITLSAWHVKMWKVDKSTTGIRQDCMQQSGSKVLQNGSELQWEKQRGRVRRPRAAKYACYQVKSKGFSRACWAELIQPSGDALCYVRWKPVGGVDPPSCMFPPSMIISPPSKSHWYVRL